MFIALCQKRRLIVASLATYGLNQCGVTPGLLLARITFYTFNTNVFGQTIQAVTPILGDTVPEFTRVGGVRCLLLTQCGNAGILPRLFLAQTGNARRQQVELELREVRPQGLPATAQFGIGIDQLCMAIAVGNQRRE